MKNAHVQHGPRIAIVATACEFPDATTPKALWDTVVNRRRCFRRLPQERLRIADYLVRGESDLDGLYPIEAALIEGYSFDRAAFRIPQHTFESTDLTHWLALDVATRALGGLPGWGADEALSERTAVIVANTLTGEFSRATLMRGRWPFVARRLHQVLTELAMPAAERDRIAFALEASYKSAFPVPSEESLAGGLSNTIAGRISNFHGLRGGAYTIDGACASSLLAVSNACGLLQSGDVCCAVVGGVDLSIDPFELIGFARNGALAKGEMRVFDAASNGFWPGEGCGFMVLATRELAEQQGWPVLGWVGGWGLSTDGRGGLTRPTVAGQRLALRRAYQRGGLSPASVDYFEAHGTGTPTGDPVELQALAQELAATGAPCSRHPVGSIKANIGHTKAAAGMAGILNALSVVSAGVVPALTGLKQAHVLLEGDGVREHLQVLADARQIERVGPAMAGVSGFGFGGVNAHLVIEGPPRPAAWPGVRVVPDSESLPGELFLLSAASRSGLLALVDRLLELARTLSRAELTDLATSLAAEPSEPCRAYAIAETPQQLEVELSALRQSLATQGAAPADDSHLRRGWRMPMPRPPVIAFVYSGQGQTVALNPLAWQRRFPHLLPTTERLASLMAQDLGGTAVMQELLADIGIAATQFLAAAGIVPGLCLGHSFGELSALHACGAYDADTFRALARARGQAMQETGASQGAMVRLPLSPQAAAELASLHGVDVACHNGPLSTVLSGKGERIDALVTAAHALGLRPTRLPTRVAFHSRALLEAAQPYRQFTAGLRLNQFQCALASTITGALLEPHEDVRELLVRQLTSPVLFLEATTCLARADLVIEVGSGDTMAAMLADACGVPCASLDLFGPTLTPGLSVMGRAWTLGVGVRLDVLCQSRGTRPFDAWRTRRFFANPCDQALEIEQAQAASALPSTRIEAPVLTAVRATEPTLAEAVSIEARLRAALVAATGLPSSDITADTRMLSDLHMNSLRVRHVVTQVAREMSMHAMPFELAEWADAPLGRLAAYLNKALESAPASNLPTMPAGIAPWVHCFETGWVPAPFLACADLPIQDSAGLHCFMVQEAFGASDLGPFLASVQSALHDQACACLVFIQTAERLNGFVRSLAKERPNLRMVLLTVPLIDAASLCMARALVDDDGEGLVERRVGPGGVLEQPVFRPASLASVDKQGLPGPQDTVLITGGAKGIGAEVARLFAGLGCRIALVGRSRAEDTQVSSTLALLRADGVKVAYAGADLGDEAQARQAIKALQAEVGQIAYVVHAVGINQPCAVERLTLDELLATVTTKVDSLRHVMAALASSPVTGLIGFGSIIGEIGLAGEAHYALANQWLKNAVQAWVEQSPVRHGWTLCWTAWKEAGMATRLDGVLQGLERDDTRALETAQALQAMKKMLGLRGRGGAVAVTGRYGLKPPTATLFDGLRFRFIESPRVHYPGIELIADARVRPDSDRYLNDHAPSGIRVFPVVFAIEAMAQCASALTGRLEPPSLHGLTMDRAITFGDHDEVTLRVRALMQDDGSVLVDVQSSSTDFTVSHFRGTVHWGAAQKATHPMPMPSPAAFEAGGLYGHLLFHGGMFRAIESFEAVSADSCCARLKGLAGTRWYSAFLAQHFLLGDPGLRDAIIHGLQVCVPHAMVLPVSVDRIDLQALAAQSRLRVHGWQVWSDGQEFIFNVEARSEDGLVVERWTGLRLRRVVPATALLGTEPRRGLPVALTGAFVERLSAHLGGGMQVRASVDAGVGRRSQRRQRALNAAMGVRAVDLVHDADGAPRMRGHHVSVSHDDHLSLVVTCQDRPVGCDMQRMTVYRDDEWALILGPQRMATARQLAQDLQEPLGLSTLRVWTAVETLIKLGRRDWPLHAASWRWESTDLGITAMAAVDGLAVVTSSFRFLGDDETRIVCIGTAQAARPELPALDPRKRQVSPSQTNASVTELEP